MNDFFYIIKKIRIYNSLVKKINFNIFDEGVFEEQLRDLSIDILNQKMYTSKVRTLKDFTKEEIKQLEIKYNCKIILPMEKINARPKDNCNKTRISKKGCRSSRNFSKSS